MVRASQSALRGAFLCKMAKTAQKLSKIDKND